jgi:hypothetical protein
LDVFKLDYLRSINNKPAYWCIKKPVLKSFILKASYKLTKLLFVKTA